MELAQCKACTPEFSSHTNGLKVSRKLTKKTKPFQFLETFFCLWVKCLINHSTFSIIYLSILSTLVVQQTR
jgi:hypothetical protein